MDDFLYIDNMADYIAAWINLAVILRVKVEK